MSGAVIGGIAAGIAVPVIMALLRKSKLFRFDADSVDIETRRRILASYKKHEVAAYLLAIGSVILLTYLFIKGFNVIHRSALPPSYNVDYALSVQPLVWFLPSFFLAILASSIVVGVVLRIWLRDRYSEYRMYDGLKYGIDSRRVMLLLSAAVIPPIIYFSVLIPQCYYYFSDSGIQISTFFSTRTNHYDYKDVTRLIEERSFKAPNGNIFHRTRYEIVFTDGYKWSTHRTVSTLAEPNEKDFMTYVSTRSGIPIHVSDPYGEPEKTQQ